MWKWKNRHQRSEEASTSEQSETQSLSTKHMINDTARKGIY